MSTNATCFHESSASKSPSLFQNGRIVLQTHHIGWFVTGAFAFLATAVSLWLVNKHLLFYSNKHQQRYIVRILFMVPIYSLVSFASYLFWNHSTPLLLLRDCYESTVLTSFFYLLLLYLSPDPDEQRSIFLKVGLSKENDRRASLDGSPVKRWIFPLGSIKAKPTDGLYFLQMMKWGVLQYCIIRPLTTLIAVILDYIGLYCEASWSPGWGHVYITAIVSISVSIAMYCLIQVYVPISQQLSSHRPLLKMFAIKAVVFLTFWQATFLSVLSSLGVIRDTQYMTAEDINIGIGAILETVEMTIFALLHIKAFSFKPYCSLLDETPDALSTYDGKPSRPSRLKALKHAFDFRETLHELWDGCVYVIRKWRGAETDVGARRLAIRRDIFYSHERKGAYSRGTLQTQDASLMEDSAPFLPQVGTGIKDRKGTGAPAPFAEVGRVGTHRNGKERRSRMRTERDRKRRSRTGLNPYPGHGAEGGRYGPFSTGDECGDDDYTPMYLSIHPDPTSSLRPSSLLYADRSDTTNPSPRPVEHEPGPEDETLARLFRYKPHSEASGPSSQTHISSNGYHVRLTTPVCVVPAEEHRTVRRAPVMVSYIGQSPQTRAYAVENARAKLAKGSGFDFDLQQGGDSEEGISLHRSKHCREPAGYRGDIR